VTSYKVQDRDDWLPLKKLFYSISMWE